MNKNECFEYDASKMVKIKYVFKWNDHRTKIVQGNNKNVYLIHLLICKIASQFIWVQCNSSHPIYRHSNIHAVQRFFGVILFILNLL